MKKQKDYRVARVNASGVIDGRTSIMGKEHAEKMAKRNNALVPPGDKTHYIVVADSPWGIAEIASAVSK